MSCVMPPWRQSCSELFQEALNAVDPCKAVRNCLSVSQNILKTSDGSAFDLSQFSKILVLGAGKGAYTMAKATEEILGGRITSGLIITKTDHGGPLEHIQVLEGTHPLPSKVNADHTLKLIERAQTADEQTLVICLISGGASALLPAPVEGISFNDKLNTTKALLACGADITEINCIRKHLSRVKGGRLLKLIEKATTLSVILSDVVGDSLNAIGSGPLTSDPTTFAHGLEICHKYSLKGKIPDNVFQYLLDGASGRHDETLSIDDPALKNVTHLLIGTNSIAVKAAATMAEKIGYTVEILSTTFVGEARELSRFFGAMLQYKSTQKPRKPLILIGGGESTVTIKGAGKGGRNQEFALAAVPVLAGIENAFAASFATDGTDGPTDAAGAWCDSLTAKRACDMGLSAEAFLRENDSYTFFKQLNDLIVTGPTGTNVCDIYLFGLL